MVILFEVSYVSVTNNCIIQNLTETFQNFVKAFQNISKTCQNASNPFKSFKIISKPCHKLFKIWDFRKKPWSLVSTLG